MRSQGCQVSKNEKAKFELSCYKRSNIQIYFEILIKCLFFARFGQKMLFSSKFEKGKIWPNLFNCSKPFLKVKMATL